MFDAQREACVAAAQAGGKVLMGFFRKLDPATITEKTKNDVVSEADREAEADVGQLGIVAGALVAEEGVGAVVLVPGEVGIRGGERGLDPASVAREIEAEIKAHLY